MLSHSEFWQRQHMPKGQLRGHLMLQAKRPSSLSIMIPPLLIMTKKKIRMEVLSGAIQSKASVGYAKHPQQVKQAP